ncbi:MAG: hypothetical protein K9M45_10035 [Kiritimatiellales bacterium]|nr:hypothetical protein [Kiritimatiellales bacterium]
MLELSAVFFGRGGWGLLSRSYYPDQKAYRNAVYRLRRDGLIVAGGQGGKTPRLALSPAAQENLPVYFDPEKAWNRKWNGIWYMFVYDVPEVDRSYRDVLRRFLKRLRLGCLQQSVWITPHDIRPQFDDLTKGAGVDSFAYLFEAQTVLGLPNRRVVDDAWDFDRLYEIQRHYCKVMETNLSRLSAARHGSEELSALVRLALDAYHGAFIEDPLLPRKLLPDSYQGENVLKIHRRLFVELNSQLQCV